MSYPSPAGLAHPSIRSAALVGRARGRFMTSVFIHMAFGLLLSAGAADLAAFNPPLSSILFTTAGLTILGWVVTFAPLALVLVLSFGAERLPAEAARLLFLLYATLVGLSLGGVVVTYSGGSIGAAFLAAAVGFAALAAFGAFQKRDLGPIGSFLTIGLAGLIAALLLNVFWRSARLDLFLSAAGVFVFAGLTALDVQRLRNLQDERPNAAVVGALILYLDMLNLFLWVLRLTARGRR